MNYQQQRKQKDEFFKRSGHSPLTAQQKQSFDGLRYYDPRPDLRYEIAVQPFDEQDDIVMQTNTGDPRTYIRYGTLNFEVGGEAVTLTLYEAPHGYFLPFVDANEDTYGAGRYLDVEEIRPDVVLVDFNLAYNPFCAYNDGWVCPITPAENRLTVRIDAGEKLPE